MIYKRGRGGLEEKESETERQENGGRRWVVESGWMMGLDD